MAGALLLVAIAGEILSGYFSFYGGTFPAVWSSTSNVWFNIPTLAASFLGALLLLGTRRQWQLIGAGLAAAVTVANLDTHISNVYSAIHGSSYGPGFVFDKGSTAIALTAVVVIVVSLAKNSTIGFSAGGAGIAFVSISTALALVFAVGYALPQRNITARDDAAGTSISHPFGLFTKYKLFSGLEPQVVYFVTVALAVLLLVFGALLKPRSLGVGVLFGWVSYMIGVAAAFLIELGRPQDLQIRTSLTLTEDISVGAVIWIAAVVAAAIFATIMALVHDRGARDLEVSLAASGPALEQARTEIGEGIESPARQPTFARPARPPRHRLIDRAVAARTAPLPAPQPGTAKVQYDLSGWNDEQRARLMKELHDAKIAYTSDRNMLTVLALHVPVVHAAIEAILGPDSPSEPRAHLDDDGAL